MRRRLRRTLSGAVVALLVVGGAVLAQQPWERFGWGGFRRVPPRFPNVESFDGAFNYCRIMYTSVRREAGGMGWWTDYPDADINFSIRFSELTKAPVSRTEEREPNHLVVRLTDPWLFQCPFAVIEDAGTARFTDEEAAKLREYLLKGGFIWSDDFWGNRAWEQWTEELAKALPFDEYPIVDLPISHAMFRTLFELKEIPQIPSIQFWRQSSGLTSERGEESREVHVRAVLDRDGRPMVMMTHNTDISDAWEREGEDPSFFYRFSVEGYGVGIDIMLYAMTH